MVLSLPKQRSTAVFAGLALACLIRGSQSLLTASPSPYFQVRNFASSQSSKKTMCLFSKKENDNDAPSFQQQTWNPLRLLVLRLGMTEPMATSPFNYGKYDGVFSCAYCDQEIFDSSAKYDSGSGWPSFWRSTADGSVKYKREMDGRLECQCARCSSHLGHVFMDGPRPSEVPELLYQTSPETDPRGKTPTYLPRFCLNGAALKYKKEESSSGNDDN